MSSWAILNPTIPETTAACNLTTSAIPVRNSVWLPLLTVLSQVIIVLDNKRAHYQRSVLDQHIPFFRRIVDRQIYNLPYRVNCRKYVAFLDGHPDHAVQRFDNIRGVDVPWRITEERIEAFPVGTPAFADLRAPVVPDVLRTYPVNTVSAAHFYQASLPEIIDNDCAPTRRIVQILQRQKGCRPCQPSFL